MAKKAANKPGEGISPREFVVTYVGSKELTTCLERLTELTGREWDRKKLDAKLNSLRKKGVMLATTSARGWGGGAGRKRIDIDELNALIKGNAKAEEKDMPKSRKD